jgi:hypothetical protein
MPSLEKRITAAVLRTIRSRRDEGTVPNQRAPSTTAVAPAKMREARYSDFAGVAELKQRWDLAADSFENWERLWQHNPALAHASVERPIGWVLEAEGKIVGYLGNILQQFFYGDKRLTAVAAHAFVVDVPYRVVALSLAAAFYRQKPADLYISTSAIEATGKMGIPFGSAVVPQPDYDTVLFWVVRPHSFAQALMKKLDVSPSLAPFGGFAGVLAIGSDRMLRRRRPHHTAMSLAVSEITPEALGDDFQTLWTEKRNERLRLLAERTPEALRWHFKIPGDRGSVCVLRCHKDGKLVGYAVVRNDTDQQNGLRKSIIADMIVRRDDPEVIKALLVAAYRHTKNIGSDVLELQGFPAEVRDICLNWRPYRRKFTACPYYYKAADPTLHKALTDPAAWYACPFDGDATLVRPSYSCSIERNAVEERVMDPETMIEVPEGQRAARTF